MGGINGLYCVPVLNNLLGVPKKLKKKKKKRINKVMETNGYF